MDYKLKKSEFYRVAYLVSGILMFLFLFGIFNLSSYAQSGTFHGWYAQENVENHAYIGLSVNSVNLDDYVGMSNPAFEFSYSFTVSKTILPDHDATNVNLQFLVHCVTSEGDRVLGFHSFPGGSGQPLSRTFTFSKFCFGIPQYAYIEIIASTSWARIAGNYSFDSRSITFTPFDFSSSSSFNFSDYSSYSPVNILNSFQATPDFGGNTFDVGQLYQFNFPYYSGTSSNFGNAWIFFKNSSSSKYTYSIYFSSSSYFTTIPDTKLFIRDQNNGDVASYNFQLVNIGSVDASIRRYYAFVNFELPREGLYQIYVGNTFPYSVYNVSYSLSVYKATIADYMNYVQSQWDNITPSVTQTNSNIADSVSTVGTASTYESAQFTSFDNLVTQTGVDTFSLSTVSTPLLWVGGLITTCYNNLPSAIQYLLMFVGVFGLIVIILNSGSRVIRRFGGDS